MSENKETKKQPELSIEQLYIEEKKKSNYLLISTVGLAVLFVGSLLYNPLNTNNFKKNIGKNNPMMNGGSQFQNRDGERMGMRGQNMSQYFNADKSLNKEAVDKFIVNLPTDFKDNLIERFPQRIDQAVSAGQITKEQGEDLLKYIQSKNDGGSI